MRTAETAAYTPAAPRIAETLLPASTGRVLRAVLLVVLGTLLLTAAAKIKVPFWPVPMTLQTFGVLMIGATYGSRLGLATVVAYLAAGALGLPVFTNTPPALAGLPYFLGTTGGFLAGFIPAVLIVGFAADRGWDRSIWKLAAAMLVADAVIFALGFAWLAGFAALPSGASGIGMAKAFAGGVQPFLLGDVVKVALGACLVPAGWRLAGGKL